MERELTKGELEEHIHDKQQRITEEFQEIGRELRYRVERQVRTAVPALLGTWATWTIARRLAGRLVASRKHRSAVAAAAPTIRVALAGTVALMVLGTTGMIRARRARRRYRQEPRPW